MLDRFQSYGLLLVKLDPSSNERSATAFLDNIKIDWSDRTSLELALEKGQSHFGVSGRWLYVTIDNPQSLFDLSDGNEQLILKCFNYSDMLLLYLGRKSSHGFAYYKAGECIRSFIQTEGTERKEIGMQIETEKQSKSTVELHQKLVEEFTGKAINDHLSLSFSMTGYTCLH